MINLSQNFIGNKSLLENLLKKIENNNLPNSIIFHGEKGIGKNTMTFNLIKESIKRSPLIKNKNNEINLLYNGTHPNIKYIKREFDEKNNKFSATINIEQIRKLENFLYQSSFNNFPKFIIVDSANDLNTNATNSLLKILEEPKKNTFFILIAHQLSNLLPTIRSRCIKFHIENPNFDYFSKIMLSNINDLNIESLNFLYVLTNSSPGLSININAEKIDFIYNQIINILLDNNTFSEDLINLSDNVSSFSNDDFKTFIILLRFILMTLAKINLGVEFSNNFPSKLFKYLYDKSNDINNELCLNMLEFLNDNENDLFTYNLDKKIFCLNTFTSLRDN